MAGTRKLLHDQFLEMALFEEPAQVGAVIIALHSATTPGTARHLQFLEKQISTESGRKSGHTRYPGERHNQGLELSGNRAAGIGVLRLKGHARGTRMLVVRLAGYLGLPFSPQLQQSDPHVDLAGLAEVVWIGVSSSVFWSQIAMKDSPENV